MAPHAALQYKTVEVAGVNSLGDLGQMPNRQAVEMAMILAGGYGVLGYKGTMAIVGAWGLAGSEQSLLMAGGIGTVLAVDDLKNDVATLSDGVGSASFIAGLKISNPTLSTINNVIGFSTGFW